jgi:hypothetical protein
MGQEELLGDEHIKWDNGQGKCLNWLFCSSAWNNAIFGNCIFFLVKQLDAIKSDKRFFFWKFCAFS